LIYDPGYISFLLDYSRRQNISAIISLFDVDLPVLARARSSFERQGVNVVVSSVDAVRVCNDKWKTGEFLRNAGIRAPRTYITLEAASEAIKNGEVTFPLIAKPRWGMGSIGVMEAGDWEELMCACRAIRRKIASGYLSFESKQDEEGCVLVQEKLTGHEFGLDILNDLDGNYVFTSVKRKLAMRAGETDAAVTVDNSHLRELGRQIAIALKHRGNLDVDLFFDGNQATVLEMNCRFGGGYPFSHMAGANFPAAILAWLRGKEAKPEWLRVAYGVTGVKGVLPVRLECSGVFP
jgi:carbamoyl-phosphate synthase large subunit